MTLPKLCPSLSPPREHAFPILSLESLQVLFFKQCTTNKPDATSQNDRKQKPVIPHQHSTGYNVYAACILTSSGLLCRQTMERRMVTWSSLQRCLRLRCGNRFCSLNVAWVATVPTMLLELVLVSTSLLYSLTIGMLLPVDIH